MKLIHNRPVPKPHSDGGAESGFQNRSNNKGGAYLMVLAASFAIFAIVLTALSITRISRQMTAHYENFFSLYDLAVGGNERAFRVLEAAFLQHGYEALAEAEETYSASIYAHRGRMDYILSEIMEVEELPEKFELYRLFSNNRYTYVYNHHWGLYVNFLDLPDDTPGILDHFTAITTVSPRGDNDFYLTSRVQKHVNASPVIPGPTPLPAVVRARVEIRTETSYYPSIYIRMGEMMRIEN